MPRRRRNEVVWGVRRRFTAFIERASDLNNTRLIRNGQEIKYDVSYNNDTKIFEVKPPTIDEDDMRSLLSLVRLFIMNNEPIFIDNIMNDGIRLSNDDEIRSMLIHAKDQWSKVFRTRGYLPFVLNQKELTPERAFDFILNSRYSHTDPSTAVLGMIEPPWKRPDQEGAAAQYFGNPL